MGASARERFGALLEDERRAAVSADVARLTSLQDEKARVLEELGSEALDDAAREALARRARSNVALMRQLVELQRALLGVAADNGSTYGVKGHRPSAFPPRMVRTG